MRVRVFQHVAFEGLGSIGPWLAARRAEVCWTRFHAGDEPPVEQDSDLLIVLGGPMSVHDEAAYPWLRQEKEYLSATLAQGKSLLAICLGAQLVASVLGATVTPAQTREMGWFQVCAVPNDAEMFTFPQAMEMFHWHAETFSLPPGTAHLARSAACPIQAFQYGKKAIGLQCHLETTPESLQELLEHCSDELQSGGPFVQPVEVMLSMPDEQYQEINHLMAQMLDYLCQ